ncbi:hypothetical protein MASR2M8_02930 [Opitutaceae bacterium]
MQLRQVCTTLLLLASFLLAVSARGECLRLESRGCATPVAMDEAGFYAVAEGEQPVPCIEALFALLVSVDVGVSLSPSRESACLLDAGRTGSCASWFYQLWSRPPPAA